MPAGMRTVKMSNEYIDEMVQTKAKTMKKEWDVMDLATKRDGNMGALNFVLIGQEALEEHR